MTFLKISDMANIMGISPNGLRKYEKYGIIKPEIDPDTGHRLYNGMHMGHLLNARRYRQFGFSLGEISDMLNHSNLELMYSKHLSHAANLEKELLYMQKRIDRLNETAEFINEINMGIRTYCIRKRPTMWFLPFMENNEYINIENSKDIYKDWMDNIPSSSVSCIMSLNEDASDEVNRYRYAISILQSDAILWDLEHIHQVEVILEKTCIYTYMLIEEGEETLYEHYLSFKTILEENELEVDGEIITRGLIFANNSKYVYREVWIPVKKKTKYTVDNEPSSADIVK